MESGRLSRLYTLHPVLIVRWVRFGGRRSIFCENISPRTSLFRPHGRFITQNDRVLGNTNLTPPQYPQKVLGNKIQWGIYCPIPLPIGVSNFSPIGSLLPNRRCIGRYWEIRCHFYWCLFIGLSKRKPRVRLVKLPGKEVTSWLK